jgi:hypothetical protein
MYGSAWMRTSSISFSSVRPFLSPGAPVQTGTSPDIRKNLVDRVGNDRGTEGV